MKVRDDHALFMRVDAATVERRAMGIVSVCPDLWGWPDFSRFFSKMSKMTMTSQETVGREIRRGLFILRISMPAFDFSFIGAFGEVAGVQRHWAPTDQDALDLARAMSWPFTVEVFDGFRKVGFAQGVIPESNSGQT